MYKFALWFPIALRHVIRQSVPKVDKFTELGRPRGRSDKEGEYRRLLDRDTNPFAFLYKGVYSVFWFLKLCETNSRQASGVDGPRIFPPIYLPNSAHLLSLL